MTQVKIFYEDQAGREVNNFGPHMLLCACVADRTQHTVTLWDLKKRIHCQPKKSDAKLLEACRQRKELELDEIVFAIFDADRVHRLPGMQHGSLEQMQAQLRALIDSPKVRPFLLDSNVETLVSAAAGCLEPPITGDIPKRHLMRDRILNNAAKAMRSVRDCVLERVPTFEAVVAAVVDVLPIPSSTR